MKKLILMTSALTLVGGAAFADITVSAKSTVTYGNWGTAAGSAAAFDFGTKVTLKLEQTAGDLTYGGELTVEDGKATAQGVIWVSGGWGKVSFGIDEFGALNAWDGSYDKVNGQKNKNDYGDVKYAGDFGNVSVTLVADAGLGWVPVTAPTWDLVLGYKAGSVDLGLETDSTGWAEVKASYAMGSFTVGAAIDNASAWDVWAKTSFSGINAKLTYDSASVTGVELDGSAGDVKWAVSGDTGGAAAASIDYTMGALSIGIAYDNGDAGSAAAPVDPTGVSAGGTGIVDRGDEADLQLTVGYKVSDNLSFEIKANDVSEYEISMSAGFTF